MSIKAKRLPKGFLQKPVAVIALSKIKALEALEVLASESG